MSVRFHVLGAAIALSACGAAGNGTGNAVAAAKPKAGIEVTRVWAQPVTAAANSAAVYISLTANCTRDDVLQSAEAVAPLKASFHASSVVDNALHMEPVPSVPILCGKPNELKPMGTHVMVTGLTGHAGIGTVIPLTLKFRDAGAVPVQAEITSMAVLENVDPMGMNKHHAKGGMKMDHGKMDHAM
jgi:copper(I)-binding protein